MYKRSVSLAVGVFIILVVLCLIFLALRVSGLGSGGSISEKYYNLNADFDSIGNLKVRSPVRLAGVVIGQVNKITLNKETYQANVNMKINSEINNIPDDSSVLITSMGLLGENYISISPGYDDSFLKEGQTFSVAYSATSISNLISTFVAGGNKGKSKSPSKINKI